MRYWQRLGLAIVVLVLATGNTATADERPAAGVRGDISLDLLARQLYLGGSVEWLFGESRNVSLDAGIGYHELDIAQVDSEWWGTVSDDARFMSSALGPDAGRLDGPLYVVRIGYSMR